MSEKRLPPGSATARELEASGRFVEPMGSQARPDTDPGLDGEVWVYVSGTDLIQTIYSRVLRAWKTIAAAPAGGAPTDADYLVGTANATLTNEIVAGPTPGGELGGTWPSPTVDQVHSGSAHQIAVVFVKAGTLATGALNIRIHAPRASTITNVTAAVNTAPTGASLIVDVNKNGTTIFTTQANRPTIAISGTEDLSSVPDVTTVAVDDVLTVDIDQIGSTIAGADLVVQIRGLG